MEGDNCEDREKSEEGRQAGGRRESCCMRSTILRRGDYGEAGEPSREWGGKPL